MARKAKSTAAAGSMTDSGITDLASSTTTSMSASNSSSSSNDASQRQKRDTDSTEKEQEDLPEVIVNKWSLNELKTGCDDAVKQYLSRPDQFKPSHLHTDVRLFLGYLSSFLALSSAYYAYINPNFQETRPYVLVAVVGFVLLSGVMSVYAKYVEGDRVFVGRKKVFNGGRISTQSLTIRTSVTPYTPIYHLSLSYTHSSNGGKTLIRQFERTIDKPFGEIYDFEGRLVRGELEDVLSGLLADAGKTGQ